MCVFNSWPLKKESREKGKLRWKDVGGGVSANTLPPEVINTAKAQKKEGSTGRTLIYRYKMRGETEVIQAGGGRKEEIWK